MISALAVALPLSVTLCQQADAVLLVETFGQASALILDVLKPAPSPQPLQRGGTLTYSQHGDGAIEDGRRYLVFATVNWDTGQIDVDTSALYQSQPTAQLRRVGPSPAAIADDDDLQYGPESDVLGRLRDAVATGSCRAAVR